MASVAKRKWTYQGKPREAWVVRWKDATGHRSRQFDKKKDADGFRQQIEAQAAQGTLAASAIPTTMATFCREWLAHRDRQNAEGTLARSSLERDHYQTENHIIRLLGQSRIGDLTANDIDGFICSLRTWKNKCLPGTMGPATVRQITRTLGQILDYAKRRGLVGQNVAREVLSWPEHREAKGKTIRTFTVSEVRALLEAIETRKPWQMQRSVDMSRAVIYLGAFCGMRAGEILGLTLDNIDWNQRLVRVRHSLDHWDNHRGPKSAAGIRDVPLPEPVAQALRQWLPYHTPNERNLVFTTRNGGRVMTEPFHRDLWRPNLKAAGLGPDKAGRRFHFHALRHFYASMMVEAMGPGAGVARLLGHRDFDMTLRVYTHSTLAPDHRPDAPDAMAANLLTLPHVAQELRKAC